MSKKLLLGLILCVGLQAANAAVPPLTATQQRELAWEHFQAIGTNALAAWYGAGRTVQSLCLTGKHAGLFALAYSRETGARAANTAANAGTRAREAAVNARTNTSTKTRETGTQILNFTAPVRNNPGTTATTLAAAGLALYFTPTWILKKAAEYTAIGVVTAVTLKAIERRNTARPQA